MNSSTSQLRPAGPVVPTIRVAVATQTTFTARGASASVGSADVVARRGETEAEIARVRARRHRYDRDPNGERNDWAPTPGHRFPPSTDRNDWACSPPSAARRTFTNPGRHP